MNRKIKLLVHGTKLIIDKFILRKSTGEVLRVFVSNMGLAYIKLAQILAMQNIGNLFTEKDRSALLRICDTVNPVSYGLIRKWIFESYGSGCCSWIKQIDRRPVGEASISQVHRGVLKTGEDVVFKVKRKDIGKYVEEDIKIIKFLLQHFGWVIGITNKLGGSKGIDLYLDWIRQELDFNNEVNNIHRYADFASTVNGKVPGCKNIVIPKVYSKYCTEDVIVMEYIPYPTISKEGAYPNDKILNGFNSYLKLSFWAMFNGETVVFHGDPHGRNIYLDNEGNIGFLDMGLLFAMDSEESRLTRELFLCAYLGLESRLLKILRQWFYGSDTQFSKFSVEVHNYLISIKQKPITNYFMDLALVCCGYDINPMTFLYKMGKALVCLNGVDNVYEQYVTGIDLVREQVIEYLLRTEVNAVTKDLLKLTPDVLTSLVKGDTAELSRVINKGIKVVEDKLFN